MYGAQQWRNEGTSSQWGQRGQRQQQSMQEVMVSMARIIEQHESGHDDNERRPPIVPLNQKCCGGGTAGCEEKVDTETCWKCQHKVCRRHSRMVWRNAAHERRPEYNWKRQRNCCSSGSQTDEQVREARRRVAAPQSQIGTSRHDRVEETAWNGGMECYECQGPLGYGLLVPGKIFGNDEQGTMWMATEWENYDIVVCGSCAETSVRRIFPMVPGSGRMTVS